MSTDLPIFIIAILILQTAFLEYGIACMVEYCAGVYTQRLDEGEIVIGMNEPYCQVITDYIHCLEGTSRNCRGNLKFHTLQTLLQRQQREFACHTFPGSVKSSYAIEKRCAFPIDTAPHTVQHFCAAFGSRHLRKFDGHFAMCAQSGAYPLLDNHHLLIQITHSTLANGANAITKVTVIVKASARCTTQKQYEANAEDELLSSSFVDGTVFDGDPERKTVEIHTGNNGTHVEIMLRHIASKIYVRRHGAYLSVALRMPERLLQQQPDDHPGICVSGCNREESIRLEAALANPDAFAQCHDVRLKMPLKIAADQCARAGVTDAFFDACVLDLLTSGDAMLVRMISDAQRDIVDMYAPYLRHYFTGRSNLTLYDESNTWNDYRWNRCVPSNTKLNWDKSTANLNKPNTLLLLLLSPVILLVRLLQSSI